MGIGKVLIYATITNLPGLAFNPAGLTFGRDLVLIGSKVDAAFITQRPLTDADADLLANGILEPIRKLVADLKDRGYRFSSS